MCVFAEQNSGDCLGRRVCSASPSMDTIYVLITGIHPAGVHTHTHTRAGGGVVVVLMNYNVV